MFDNSISISLPCGLGTKMHMGNGVHNCGLRQRHPSKSVGFQSGCHRSRDDLVSLAMRKHLA